MKSVFVFLNVLIIGLLIGTNYKLYSKIERVESTSRLALYGTYCNNYHNRALESFVRNGNWEGYAMFPPVCLVQYSLERLDSVKFRGEVPEYVELVHNYDSFFTGKGHDGERINKMLREANKKYTKEYEEYTKGLGVTKKFDDWKRR